MAPVVSGYHIGQYRCPIKKCLFRNSHPSLLSMIVKSSREMG